MDKIKKIIILFSYSFSHAVVDFICACIVLSTHSRWFFWTKTAYFAILAYNILAFWLQTFFGHIADKLKCAKLTWLLGCVFVIIWIIFLNLSPWAAIIFAWIWNALFHIWWWIVCISTNPEKATPSWIFVAPGAIWLYLWTLIGKSWKFIWWLWIILLVVSILSIWLSSKNYNIYNIIKEFNEKEKNNQNFLKKIITPIILALLVSITIRSFIGFIISYQRKIWILSTIFVICIVLWKAIWWILADKFWWIRVWITSLLISLPCLLLWEQSVLFWLLWIFLFNITMSIALAALIKSMPNRWWFAFWLLCLSLLIWSLPSLLWINFYWYEHKLIVILILCSSLFLYITLDKLWVKKIKL